MARIVFILCFMIIFSLGLSAQNPSAIVQTTLGDIEIELFYEKTPLTVKSFYLLSKGKKDWIDIRDKKIYHTPYYDSLTIHRVVSNFVIQMGCYLGNSKSDPGFVVPDEIYDGKEIKGRIGDEVVARRVMEEIIIPFIKNKRDKLLGNPKIVQLFKECSIQKSARPLMQYPIEYYLSTTGYEGKFTRKTKIKTLMEYGCVALANNGAPASGNAQFFIVTRMDGLPKMDGKFTIFGKVKSGMDIVHKIESVKVDKRYAPLKPIYILGIKFKDNENKLRGLK